MDGALSDLTIDVSGASSLVRARLALTYQWGARLDARWELSRVERAALEARMLARMLRAARRTDAYRQFLPQGAITCSVADDALAGLPMLTKMQLRGHEREFATRGFAVHATTSGTTGTPIKLVRSPKSVLMEEAWVQHCRSWSGYRVGDRVAVLRGTVLSDDGGSMPPFRFDELNGLLTLSSYHLTPETAHAYISLLQRYSVRWVAAYPSSITNLALIARRAGAAQHELRGVFTSSEVVTSASRALVTDVFDARIWDFYGTAERVAAAAECEAGRYHMLPGYSITETQEDVLVGTTLCNTRMPLLRYVTGDVVVDGQEDNCLCGRSGATVGAIEGRQDDVIVGHGGRLVGRLDPVFKGVTGVVAAQIVQEAPGEVLARVVPDPAEFAPSIIASLEDALRQRLGHIRIVVEVVDRLEQTPAGKIPFILQRLDLSKELDA